MYYNDQEASNYEPSADYYTENDVAVPWTEFYRWNTNKESISTVAFDHFAELLWIGHQDGRLSSYTFPDMTNYTSIRSHNHPVSAILSCPRGIVSIAADSASLRTRGCASIHTFNVPLDMPQLRCGTLTSIDSFDSTRVILGGDQPKLYGFDLNRPKKPATTMDLRTHGVSAIAYSSQTLVCGGTTGHIELIDAQMRSLRVQYSVAAFTGNVNAIAVHENVILSCGMHAHSINPYDRNAPVQLYPDMMLKQFDMRTMQLISSTPLPSGSPPSFIKFLPSEEGRGPPRTLVGTNSGELFVYDANEAGLYTLSECYQVGTDDAMVTSMDVSLYGNFLAFGDVTSTAILWSDSYSEPVLNPGISQPLSFPPFYTPPPLSITDVNESPASKYFIQKPKERVLASAINGKLRNSVLRPQPARRISQSLLDKVQKQGSLGYTANPGYKLNSMLFGEGREAYDVVDPRLAKGNTAAQLLRRSSSRYSVENSATLHSGGHPKVKSNRSTSTDEKELTIPTRYRSVKIRLSKRGMDGFDFVRYNATGLPGLENKDSRSYTNPVLQLLYYTPEFRYQLLDHYCLNDGCLCCELSFLFHMMDQSRMNFSQFPCCQSKNFLNAFGQASEVTALGLLNIEGRDAAGRIESFYRFLLNHVNTNLNLEHPNKMRPIDDIFGITSLQTNTCCENHNENRETVARVIELIYPPEYCSFSTVVQKSLTRSLQTRAWCDSCGDYKPITQTRRPTTLPRLMSFQCGRGKDVIDTLWRSGGDNTSWLPSHIRLASLKINSTDPSKPKLLVAERVKPTDADMEATWKWIGGDVDNNYDVKEYILMGVVENIKTEATEVKDYLAAHVLIPEGYRCNDASESNYENDWVLFNDFRVSKTILCDALAFHPVWKYPCILQYREASTMKILSTPAEIATECKIPLGIFRTPSLSTRLSASLTFKTLSEAEFPRKGDRVAIDTEFVNVEMEQATLSAKGQRVVTKEGRQALARVSVIHGETNIPFIDDYIVPSEPVVDYLTRFSGLKPVDLDLSLSPHHLVTLKTAYSKLRLLVDRGCIFVGHGLRTDFRIINIQVPASQVYDTVELYHQPSMRKIALRFLTVYLLKADIQSDTHDSIEDARAALLLHNKYLQLVDVGIFEKTLQEIYTAGRQCKWKTADLIFD